MATREWRGDAPAVAQVVSVTAPELDGPVEFYIGGRPLGWNRPWFPVNGNWPTASLVAMWNSSPLGEFQEVRASGSAEKLTLTAVEPGRPFIVTATVGGQTLSSEIQRVIVSRATGGTFTLSFNGETTAAIAYNANAAAVKSALEGLATIAPGDVTVTGDSGDWTVTFGGAYSQTNVPRLIANYPGLTGGTCSVLVTSQAEGVAPINEVQILTLPGAPTGGTFTLSLNGTTTAGIAYNANAAAVQAALVAVLGANVTCTGGALPGTAVTITFSGDLAGTDLPLLVPDSSGLTGAALAMSITETTAGVAGTNAKYRFKLTGDPEVPDSFGTTGLTFRMVISRGSQVWQTSELSYDDSAATIQAALESMKDINTGQETGDTYPFCGPGNVAVSGTMVSSWGGGTNVLEIEFVNDWHSTRVQLTASETNAHANVAIQTTVVSLGFEGTNETQTLTQTGTPSGSFRLGFGGYTSDPIAYGSTALQIEDVLVRMPSIGQAGEYYTRPDAVVVNYFPNLHGSIFSTRASVRVTGGPLGTSPVTLTFASNGLQSTNVALMTLDEGAASVTASVDGVAGVSEVQQVTIIGSPWGGTFTLTYNGQTTGAISYNAPASEVLAALEALSNLAPGDVTVGKSGEAWTVAFAAALGNVPIMSGDGESLKNGLVTTSTEAEGGLTVAISTLVRSRGPWHFDDALNWLPVGVPGSGDSVLLQFGDTGPRWGLSQLSEFELDPSDGSKLILAEPCDFVWNQEVTVDSSGTLPTGLSAGVNYFAQPINNRTLKLSATYNGAPITFTGGSGTHRVFLKLAGYLSVSSWAGWTGTRTINEADFREYRPLYLSCGWVDGSRIVLGEGPSGSGSQLQRFNTHDFRVAFEVLATQGSVESELPAALWIGQHADNVAEVIGGELGIALLRGESAELKRLTIRAGDCSLGAGVTFPAGSVIDKTGGNLSSKAVLDGVLWLRG